MKGLAFLRNLTLLHLFSWVPLGLAAIIALSMPDNSAARQFALTYAAGLLFFAIGVRFGMHYGRFNALVWHQKLIALIPLVLIGALMAAGDAGMGILVFAYAAQGAIDTWGGHVGVVPDRYVQARMFATGLIAATLIALILF